MLAVFTTQCSLAALTILKLLKKHKLLYQIMDCLVEGLQKIIHVERIMPLKEIQTLILFLEQNCRVLSSVKLVIENGSHVLVLVDSFCLLPFDLKRDG